MRQGSIKDFFTRSPAISKSVGKPPIVAPVTPVPSTLKRKNLEVLSLPEKTPKVERPASLPPKSALESKKQEFDLPEFTLPEFIKDIKGRRPDHPDYDPSTLWVPNDYKSTPAQQQYWQIKAQHNDSVLFFKLGKFYELFYQDAILTQRILELNWMGEARKCHVGFPERVLDKNASKLVELGYKVVVVEQTETPEQLKERNKTETKKSKAVNREITDVFTKGTYIDEGEAGSFESRYLAAVVQQESAIALVLTDCSTAKIQLLECGLKEFYTVIAQTQPSEVLYDPMYLEYSVLRCLKESPCHPTMTSKKDSAFWDPFNLPSHFPTDLPTFLQPITNPLLLRAIKGTCAYLERNLLAQKVLPFAQWSNFTSGAQKHLTMDFRALDALEILQVRVGNTSQKEGSLLHFLDRTSTPFGKRLLKRWICMPLTYIPSILQRQAAVFELFTSQMSISAFERAAKGIQDVEKQLSRLARHSTLHSSNAIYFEDVNVKQVKDFEQVLKQLKTLEEAQMTMERFEFVSERLRLLSRPESVGGLFPELADLCESFKRRVCWVTDTVVQPSDGACPEFDSAKASADSIIAELETYLRLQKTRFNNKPGISYVDIKFRYEIEVPDTLVSGDLKPKDYELTSSKQGFQRFLTTEVKTLVSKLEKAEEVMKGAMKMYLSHMFRSFLEQRERMNLAINVIGECDCLCALAKSAQSYQGDICRPTFTESEHAYFSAIGLKHPVLAARLPNFIPNDINLTDVSPCMVLTGPNMGGKSTVLRQVCVAAVLAQAGGLVPATSLTLAPVDRIFTRVGASDDLFQGKSTFAIEMEEAAEVFRSATARSLVIMDELGRGTGTTDGAAIAFTTLKRISTSIGCRMIFTTHYHMLMDRIRELQSVQLFHMAADVNETDDKIRFLYQLQPGECPGSFGLNVARMAGIPESIILRAKEESRRVEKEMKAKRIVNYMQSLPPDANKRELLQDFLSKIKW